MAIHILKMKNRKGQLNVGFILSVVLFAALLIVATVSIFNLFPLFKGKIDKDVLKSKAIDLSIVLVDKPGVPNDWAASPAVVGFAKYNNYSNETVIGVLDPVKVNYVNASMNYSEVKNSLNLDADIDFRLIIENSTSIVMDLFNVTAGRTDSVVVIKRLSVLNTTAVNVTLLVW